jgi:MoxR-like ATPase
VLTRIAEALGVAHRHYNASLLNFDDLIGFPVPEGGKLVYLQTPATIWDAESVFFDEVSRCRPDLQNKLFPIVHERRVQGVALERLRFRWAAMNPPPRTDGGKEQGFAYAGAEPLDVALADRFAFVIAVPDLSSLSAEDQRIVVVGERQVGTANRTADTLLDLLACVRTHLPAAHEELRATAGEYVQVAAQKLAQAHHPISTRRAVQIARNIEALAAVFRARNDETPPEDAFYLALRHSIPDAAWGQPIDGPALLAVHRAAWEIARLEHTALKELLREPDPVRRLVLALGAGGLSAGQRGQIVADCYASLDRPTRLVTAAVLMPLVGDGADLPAASIESIANDYAAIAGGGDVGVTVSRGGSDWKRTILGQWLSSVDLTGARGKVLANAAAVLMRDEHGFSAAHLEQAFDHAVACLRASSGERQQGHSRHKGAAR